MTHALSLTAICLLATPGCASLSPWPAIDLTLSTTLTRASSGGARHARASTRLGAALRWQPRLRPALAPGVAGRTATPSFATAYAPGDACTLEAACAWEQTERDRTLSVLREAGAR